MSLVNVEWHHLMTSQCMMPWNLHCYICTYVQTAAKIHDYLWTNLWLVQMFIAIFSFLTIWKDLNVYLNTRYFVCFLLELFCLFCCLFDILFKRLVNWAKTLLYSLYDKASIHFVTQSACTTSCLTLWH